MAKSASKTPAPPSFWILDGRAPSGRNGLYGIAMSMVATWWDTEFGRMHTGRDGAWGGGDTVEDAPVSVTFHYPPDAERGSWYTMGARGHLGRWHGTTTMRRVDVRGTMRRIRWLGSTLVAVGAHGEVVRGTFDQGMTPVEGLFDAGAGRFLTDVVGRSGDDFTVTGRKGEVFHWTGMAWEDWSPGGADLHVALLGDTLLVGGDGGRILERSGTTWRVIKVPTREPIVGLARVGTTLWASTPTALFKGTRTLTKATSPGFGGQLDVGDGILHCFGVAELARLEGKAWKTIAHPDQHVRGTTPEWPVLGASLDEAVKERVDPAAQLGGRLFTEADATAADVKRWSKNAKNVKYVRELLTELGMYRVVEIDGDLHVKGDLDPLGMKLVGLIVHGDLVVDGVFRDAEYPVTVTVIGGSLRAKTVITWGHLEVKGALSCEHLIGFGNDYGATIGGKATARLFWPEYHHFDFAKKPAFTLSVPGSPSKSLLAAVQDKWFTGTKRDLPEERELRRDAVIAALAAGTSIWRR